MNIPTVFTCAINQAVASDALEIYSCITMSYYNSTLLELSQGDHSCIDKMYQEIEHNKSHYIVARHQQEIIGVLQWAEKNDGGLWFNAPIDYWIKRLFVHPEYQQKKVGSQLVSYFLSGNLLDGSEVFLYVDVCNKKAQKFYKKIGFKQLGLWDMYEPGYEKYIIMQNSVDVLRHSVVNRL